MMTAIQTTQILQSNFSTSAVRYARDSSGSMLKIGARLGQKPEPTEDDSELGQKAGDGEAEET